MFFIVKVLSFPTSPHSNIHKHTYTIHPFNPGYHFQVLCIHNPPVNMTYKIVEKEVKDIGYGLMSEPYPDYFSEDMDRSTNNL